VMCAIKEDDPNINPKEREKLFLTILLFFGLAIFTTKLIPDIPLARERMWKARQYLLHMMISATLVGIGFVAVKGHIEGWTFEDFEEWTPTMIAKQKNLADSVPNKTYKLFGGSISDKIEVNGKLVLKYRNMKAKDFLPPNNLTDLSDEQLARWKITKKINDEITEPADLVDVLKDRDFDKYYALTDTGNENGRFLFQLPKKSGYSADGIKIGLGVIGVSLLLTGYVGWQYYKEWAKLDYVAYSERQKAEIDKQLEIRTGNKEVTEKLKRVVTDKFDIENENIEADQRATARYKKRRSSSSGSS